jgi:hypothetical protein
MKGNEDASDISAPFKLPCYDRTTPGYKQASRAHLPQDGDPSINWHIFQLIDNYRFTLVA